MVTSNSILNKLIRKYLRLHISRILEFLEIPGNLYTTGAYKYTNGAIIFPNHNAHMLTIADGISLHETFFNLWSEVTLETGVVVGHQVMFLTGGHEIDEFGVKIPAISRGRILVKEKAWLGSRSIILGGVVIGNGSVIGAGSVVTKSVPDHEFWAGNPAKFIRNYTSDQSLG